MSNIKIGEAYLWKKRSSQKYPWQRYYGSEFLKYEQKRIRDVFKWYSKFEDAKIGQELEEVYYYVIPIELDSRWKATIALEGDYNYQGLSALKNCLMCNILMLMPKDKRLPQDYSLIRVTKAKKDILLKKGSIFGEHIIKVESFEEIDPSYVYLDVPYEKRSITKFIKENIVDDNLIANSFQPTISGSPYVINRKGGISLSTFQKNGSFSEELMKTLKLMQPIEFTDLQFKLPPKLIKGRKEGLWGINFLLAEKSILGENFFTAFSSNNYGELNSELIKRDMFKGEYSIACSLTPRGHNASELLRDILSKFVKTEIMHPFSLEELKMWEVDLSVAQRNIDEDLRLQVVNQKQLNPVVDFETFEILKLRKALIPEWEAILESFGLKKNIDHEAKVYSQASFKNIIKVAQSISRDEGKNQVSESIINKSFKLFSENTDSLTNNDEIQKYAKVVIPEMYESAKFNAVRAELSVNLLDLKDLFNNVKGFFKDIYELQDYIDKKLLLIGYIFEPRRGFYKWI